MKDAVHDDVLFAEVVEASGLSAIIGPGTIRRALRDVGSAPQRADEQTYLRAMPAIEARLGAFMNHDEVQAAVRRIRHALGRRRMAE